MHLSSVTTLETRPDPTQSDALQAWRWPGKIYLSPIQTGLINVSFAISTVKGGTPFAVLQRLNTEIFTDAINTDIAAVTHRLQQKGLLTPTLMETKNRSLFHIDEKGQTWRCMTWVGQRTISKLTSAREAMSAARLVAQFHIALHDFDWTFHFSRPDAHNTALHMTHLQNTLFTHKRHRMYSRTLPIVERILDHWEHYQGPPPLPKRLIHGDLKISNVRFNGSKAVSLIDLDTIGFSTLDVELGDALRSWCNTASENSEQAHLDVDIFEAAMRGYARMARTGPPVLEAEWNSIVPGFERIALELAARFARDAMEEKYFGWNPKYGTRGEHNLLRAKGQYSLALAIHNRRQELESLLNKSRKAR